MKDTVSRERAQVARADSLALGPYAVWAVLFILVPLVFVAYYAFTDNSFHFTLDNVRRFFTATSTVIGSDGSAQEVRTYLLIFWRSLKLAVISTVICLVFGYPIAYIMARAEPRIQKTFMTIIMIPMWMNFLIRTYAWMTILQDKGMLRGVVTSVTFLGVHYEIIVDINGFKWMIQTTDYAAEGEKVGIYIEPDAIHIMKKSEYSGMFGDYSSYSMEMDELSVVESEDDQ